VARLANDSFVHGASEANISGKGWRLEMHRPGQTEMS